MRLGTLSLTTTWLVLGVIVCQASGALCLRMAGNTAGRTAVLYFLAGNTLGFCGTVFITFALRQTNPNLIYALCQGIGFCVLQLAAFFLFRQPLTTVQWLGVMLIASGVVCLQVR